MPEGTKHQWFVVQTLSGHEYKVRDRIEKQKVNDGVEDKIPAVEVPTEKVAEVKRGKRTTRDRKFFPGYILVQMSLYKDDGDFDEEVWHYVNSTEGVIGLIGGSKPVPISESEVEKIVNQAKESEEKTKPKITFEVGETVTIIEGAFANFEGQVEEVDEERGKLKLSVNIFGRSTPVEVESWQVERTE